MKLRTFMASSMAEAFALVKAQLGPRAVILHTRTYKRGGLMGLGGRSVVEITAAEGEPVAPARRPEPAPTPSRRLDADANAGDLIRRTYALAKAELSRQHAAQAAANAGALAPADPGPAAFASSGAGSGIAAGGLRPFAVNAPHAGAPPRVAHAGAPAGSTAAAAAGSPSQSAPLFQAPPARPAPNDDLAREMREVHRLVARLARQQGQGAAVGQPGATGAQGATAASPSPADSPGPLFDQYLALLRNEVAEELAEKVVQQVREKLPASRLQDARAVRAAMLDALARHVQTDEGLTAPAPPSDGRPRTIALVGPTGVGKTTTVAKLAATFKLKQKLRVGLVTIDTYRIAAVDQLRTYANIIGVPLAVAMTPREIIQALEQFSAGPGRVDVVLIDTAGRSQRDDPRLEQLRAFIEAARPHEVHLVLSSTCSQPVLLETVERFASVRTERIIFTKLDEAVSFGVVVNVVSKVNKRLSYVTTGQEVPHQIEPGRASRLAELVLGGE